MMRRTTVFTKTTKAKKRQKVQTMINKKGQLELIWNKLKTRKEKDLAQWHTLNSWKKS